MSTELEQLRARAEAAEQWQHTFAGLGGTPEIAWGFYKGLENNKIAWQKRAEAAKALVEELRVALKAVSRRAPIMGSTGDYREGQKDALQAVREQAATALAKTPESVCAELARLREMHLNQFTNLEQALEERDALRARLAELERDNGRLQMELDASCNAEELRQVREALAATERDRARLIEAGDLLVASESLEVGWHEAVAAWQSAKEDGK
jgi:hypothetical protein